MSNKVKPLIVTTEEAGQRLDKWIKFHFTNISKIMVEKLCRTGQIRVDSARVKPNIKLFENQLIRIPNFIRYNNKKIDKVFTNRDTDLFNKLKEAIVYEDDYFLIFNKPFGLAVQGGSKLGNVHLDGILPLFSKNKLSPPKLVHRLDKETSGVMVVAKSDRAYHSLVDQFSKRQTEKEYLALVCGLPKEDSGNIDLPIGRHPKVRVRMAVVKNGKEAITKWKMISKYRDEYGLLSISILTGRTHQIRVHFSYLGYPLAGDKTYGSKKKSPFPRVMLHAHTLKFKHPVSSDEIFFKSELPEDFKSELKKLELN